MMKKLSLTIALAFAALLMTQCRKTDIQPVQNDTPEAELVEFSLSASSGDDKASIDGFTINWSVGDKVFVVDMDASGNGLLGCLSAVSGGTTTTEFKGGITAPAAGHRCMFYYVGSNTFTLNGSGQYEYNVGEQYGALNGTNSVAKMLLMKSNSVTVTEAMLMNHNFGSSSVTFKSMIAVSRLSFTVNSSAYTGNVTMTGGYSSAKLNPKDGTLSAVAGNVTLKSVSSNYFVTLIPANQNDGGGTLNLSFIATSEDNEEMGIAPTVAAGMFYNYSSAKVINMVDETNEWINFNDRSMGITGMPKWAKKNLGASNGSSANSWYGDYYAWGEIETYYADGHAYDNPCGSWRSGKENGYTAVTYPYHNGTQETGEQPYDAVTEILKPAFDVARAKTSDVWRMPTGGAIDASGKGEWQQLKDNTYWVWVSDYNGVSGLYGYIIYRVKNIADKGKVKNNATSDTPSATYDYLSDPHMFLPAAGYRTGDIRDYLTTCIYWASLLYRHPTYGPQYGYGTFFGAGEVSPQNYSSRWAGLTIRPVR